MISVSPPGRCSGRRGTRTHNPVKGRPASNGAAFQFACLPTNLEWSHRESHPDLRHARAVSSCWTMTPYRVARSGPAGSRTRISASRRRRRPVGPWARPSSVDRRGVAPRSPACRAGVVLLDQQPPSSNQRSARDSNPNRLPTTEACRRNTCGPKEPSRPGRTRTCAILRVRQASWPLDDGTMQ